MSNIVNLAWRQVNLFNRMIIIDKTKNGDPVGIPMTDIVFQTLKELNKVRRINSDFVFPGKEGRAIHKDWVTHSFTKVCRAAGIKDLRFHDLRHDFCSRLARKGVSLQAIKELAGHRDIKSTLRYAHLCPENLKSAIETLNTKADYNLTTAGNLNENISG